MVIRDSNQRLWWHESISPSSKTVTLQKPRLALLKNQKIQFQHCSPLMKSDYKECDASLSVLSRSFSIEELVYDLHT